MVQVLDNAAIKLEIMPGTSGQRFQGQAEQQAEGVQQQIQGVASSAQDQARGAVAVAQTHAQSYSETAQQKAGDYQQGAASSIKCNAEGGQKAAQGYVDEGKDYAHHTAKDRLPEGSQGFGGQAVEYGGNLATGIVGTVGGGVKDLGDTVGNAGYQTVAGLGKTGYNLGSGLGRAVTGKAAAKEGDNKAADEPEP